MRQAFSVHVHVAEVLAGTGVYKCPQNLWAPTCAPEARNNASSTVRGPRILEWPLNLTVIWHSSVGVCKPLLIVMKWTDVMILKIVHGTVKQLRTSRMYAALCLLSTRGKISALSPLKFVSYFKGKSSTSVTKVLQIQGCWYVLSPTYFPMCFVWWLE